MFQGCLGFRPSPLNAIYIFGRQRTANYCRTHQKLSGGRWVCRVCFHLHKLEKWMKIEPQILHLYLYIFIRIFTLLQSQFQVILQWSSMASHGIINSLFWSCMALILFLKNDYFQMRFLYKRNLRTSWFRNEGEINRINFISSWKTTHYWSVYGFKGTVGNQAFPPFFRLRTTLH